MPTQETNNGEILLETRGIRKSFPGVLALDDISICVRRGEVHGLVGKNGAGKSTLIKIICGQYTPDRGILYWNKEEFSHLLPSQALSLGIQVVPQEVQLQPHLTVWENFFVGGWPTTKAGFVDHRLARKMAKNELAKMNIDIPSERLVRDLPLVQRQILALAKAIFSKAKLIILDEPTPYLTTGETQLLFQYIRDLAGHGTTFIYISHYLNEVFEVCDTVTVLRNGRQTHTGPTRALTGSQLIEHMIGKTMESQTDYEAEIGPEIVRVEGLSSHGRFENVSFSIRQGEILALTGLMGCGSFDLAKALFGLVPLSAGSVRIDGKDVHLESPEAALKQGIALLPDDRRGLALIVGMSVESNINLSILRRLTNAWGLIRAGYARDKAKHYVHLLGISTPSLAQEVRLLSGGNQQKVVFSRLLNTEPRILVMMDPTAGIDVETKTEIHRLMADLARQRIVILLLSSDIDEILKIADRILVMHQGRIVKEYLRKAASRQAILAASEGLPKDQPA
jgi:ABC-type sugar transport system ATPase subunit